jgi:hypothetical protein
MLCLTMYIRDIYISKLQTSTNVKLKNHNAMFDHVYQVDIYN